MSRVALTVRCASKEAYRVNVVVVVVVGRSTWTMTERKTFWWRQWAIRHAGL